MTKEQEQENWKAIIEEGYEGDYPRVLSEMKASQAEAKKRSHTLLSERLERDILLIEELLQEGAPSETKPETV